MGRWGDGAWEKGRSAYAAHVAQDEERVGRAAEGLTRDQVAEVLRRAAELDADDATPSHLSELVSPAVVEDAAVEAGLSRTAVRRALVELALSTQAPATVSAPEVVKGGRVVLVRRVPGTPEAVTERVDRFLRRQLFVRERIYDGGSWWAPDRSQNARMRRDMDLKGRHALRPAASVDVRVVRDTTADDDHVVVRFEVDVSGLKQRQRRALTRTTTVGLGVSGGLALIIGPEALLVGAPVAAGVGARRQFRARDRARRDVSRIDVALNGLLDRIEHEVPDERGISSRSSSRSAGRANRDRGRRDGRVARPDSSADPTEG